MSTEATSVSNSVSHKAWVAKRIHSFVGIVPLGVYLVLHLSRNLSTLGGAEAFDSAVRESWKSPINYLWVALLVYLPLVYHAGYGFYLTFTSNKQNVFKYPNLENVRYLFQRISAVGLLGFLCAHIFLTRVHVSMGWLQSSANPSGQVTFAYFAEHMWHNPFTAPTYLLGILATAYHLGNGVSTFCISWGITTGDKAIKKANIVALVVGILILVVGYAAVAGFFLPGAPAKFVTPGGPMSPEGLFGPLLHMIEI
jgi:succinate dehydrogenase / fumarate reductase, cytochrome b subunit